VEWTAQPAASSQQLGQYSYAVGHGISLYSFAMNFLESSINTVDHCARMRLQRLSMTAWSSPMKLQQKWAHYYFYFIFWVISTKLQTWKLD